MRKIASILAAIAAFTSASALACTTFLLEHEGKRYMGKNYDWHMGHGIVLENRRGVAKQALPMMPGDQPPQWVSKYASLTFNQYGREFPNGGMNEAGLTLEVLWLDESKYPAKDARPTVSELQWVQYQLDNFGSVAEVVKNADKLRVSSVYGKVHYFACDPTGACATFEYLNGALAVAAGEQLPTRALTNHSYVESIGYVKLLDPKKKPSTSSSLDRFTRAARATTTPLKAGADPLKHAFAILDDVQRPDTQWSIVYDLTERRIHFKTRNAKAVRTVELKGLQEAACKAEPVRSIDLEPKASGTAFVPFDDGAHKKLIERSTASIKQHLPPNAVDSMVRYAGSLSCAKAP